MAKRKALSRKTRFEVLKRDSFKCQYCGASAPDSLLQIDHITPVADGGSNDMLNLAASCQPCNSGKGARQLDNRSAVERQRAQLDDAQERRDQIDMMIEWQKNLVREDDHALRSVEEFWSGLAPGWVMNDALRTDLRKWADKYSMQELLEAMRIAATQYLIFDGARVTQRSWLLAFGKIPGCAWVGRQKKDCPEIDQLLYARGILRRNIHYAAPRKSEFLRDLRSMWSKGYSATQITDASKTIDTVAQYNQWVSEWTDG